MRYQADYQGTGELMRSPEMLALVSEKGALALAHAVEISPVRTGEFAGGWRLEARSDGGPRANRAEAQVVNDAADEVLADVVDGHDVPARLLAYLEETGAA